MVTNTVLIEHAKPMDMALRTNDTEGLTIIGDCVKKKQSSFAEDVLRGLTADEKYLSPKYFYDREGSDLFVKITQTEEYYPTRTELSILNVYSSEIVNTCEHVNWLVELGSGSSEKTNALLSDFHRKRRTFNYIPIDVSDIIIESGRKLLEKYDRLSVTGILSDYGKGLELVSKVDNGSKLILFLGSSIGNFTLDEIRSFLEMTYQAMHYSDYILIGFDLVKDHQVLEDAYNDSEGVTADFNYNLLKRINNELDGNFDLNKFEHQAFFNEQESRIEMHLVSKEDQAVSIGAINKKISFKSGETIHTENSHKFTLDMIDSFADSAHLEVIHSWTDPRKYFALCLLRKKQ
jgi:dimethylhistidine N-methyltransferase